MCKIWQAVVVAQLVVRSFPPPEGHGSNPVIGVFLHGPFFNLFKTVRKRKRGRDWPIPRTGRTITGLDLTNQVNLLALLPVQSNPLNKIVNQSDHFTSKLSPFQLK